MKTIFKTLLAIAIALPFTQCNMQTNRTESLTNARQAIANGEYEIAIASLEDAANSLSDSTASPTKLSELALLYMIANDHAADDDYSLKALDAYRRAVKINADSVETFITTLAPDEMQYLLILSSLSSSIDNAINGVEIEEFEEGFYEENDSLNTVTE
ncbi:MAG: hypothetical protein J6R27_02000 [Muribaculaceae bacterium]|nr:hypothetical protein [Muribaculaceae bacterium]